MLFMSINWPIVFYAHISRSDGGLSCCITANHVKECYLSASVKDWSHFQLFPLTFTITASISLGENIFSSLRYLIAIFRIDIYAMYFSLPAVGPLFRPTFAENDNLISMDIVNNQLLFEFLLKPP